LIFKDFFKNKKENWVGFSKLFENIDLVILKKKRKRKKSSENCPTLYGTCVHAYI
jgi:hypothetical protein